MSGGIRPDQAAPRISSNGDANARETFDPEGLAALGTMHVLISPRARSAQHQDLPVGQVENPTHRDARGRLTRSLLVTVSQATELSATSAMSNAAR